VPRVPPRLLAPLIRLLGARRLVSWAFRHYLRIAPPEFARGSLGQPAARAAVPVAGPA